VKILISSTAEADLLAACEYLARDNPGAAQRLLEKFQQVTSDLASSLIEGPEIVMDDGRPARA
jgi:plasmid stabilization system protein ParE